MNKRSVKREALSKMPAVEATLMPGVSRHNLALLLDGDDNIGIELGVASGAYSERLLNSNKFNVLIGVDTYGDTHDTREYIQTLQRLGSDQRYKLLRLTFDEALEIFPDAYFDFIYVDGFAHTGEEGGKTIVDWYKKLKLGGIMSGDDYHPDWPLVMWAVNHFASQLKLPVSLTECVQTDPYSKYPSWYIRKGEDEYLRKVTTDPRLITLAKSEKSRIHRQRMWKLNSIRQKILRTIRHFS